MLRSKFELFRNLLILKMPIYPFDLVCILQTDLTTNFLNIRQEISYQNSCTKPVLNFPSIHLNTNLKKSKKTRKESLVFKYMGFRIIRNSRCVSISALLQDHESKQLATCLATNRSFTYQVTAWVISGRHLDTN